MNRSGTYGSRSRSRMEQRGRLVTPRRNNFFNGKKMDAYLFELETGYGIGMRRMLNRMALGGGVVCGLDVTPGDTRCSVRITAGLAIDGWGREIVVPDDSAPVVIPQNLLDRVCETGNGGEQSTSANGKETGDQTESKGNRPPKENGERPG